MVNISCSDIIMFVRVLLIYWVLIFTQSAILSYKLNQSSVNNIWSFNCTINLWFYSFEINDNKCEQKCFRNKNEAMLAVPGDNMDAQSVAGSEEPEVDFRKKIKYGSRIQVCSVITFICVRNMC